MSYWRARAQDLILSLVAELPDDATLADRKKALWGKGYNAHGNTSWGRKMWGAEVRKHLAVYGMPIKKVTSITRYSPITGQMETVKLSSIQPSLFEGQP